MAKNPLVYETDRLEEFSPVKNAEGPDSPATCRRDQTRRAGRWLSKTGVKVPQKDGQPDCTLEISPLFAERAEQLRGKKLPSEIRASESVYLGE